MRLDRPLIILLIAAAAPTFLHADDLPTDAELLAGAQDRIERHRKADLTILVRDSEGRPIPGATVELTQTRHAFLFGSNIFAWGKVGTPAEEQAYRDQFTAVFNFATLPFYWPSYERQRDQPAHDNRLEIARWCAAQGIKTKGHPLAWNYSDPRWLPDDPAQAYQLQLARIDDILPRFRGLIDTWDVVNEATHYERDEFRQRAPRMTAMWDSVGRVEFTEACLQRARAANPAATLLVNDYRTDTAYAQLLQTLIDRNGGTPLFDAIGIQSHQHSGTWTNRQIWETCERFAPFGLPLHFTETTIVSGENGWDLARDGKPWPSTPEAEANQADEVERFYTMVFSHPAVTALTWWDFSDRNAWLHAPAGFLREDLSPKPAYDRLKSLITDRWWTRATLSTDSNGAATTRGFHGDYHVTLHLPDGRILERDLTLTAGAPNRLEMTLPETPE